MKNFEKRFKGADGFGKMLLRKRDFRGGKITGSSCFGREGTRLLIRGEMAGLPCYPFTFLEEARRANKEEMESEGGNGGGGSDGSPPQPTSCTLRPPYWVEQI
ncbi:hypothetical protein Nepgr_014503 [Nepenthes gracilis]|uniref:Uncharacterized protein n=1 Tax=Nepenthes gracilis TaxID=150966 RepID=A0AAD3SL84_NEPGR|nr:hypothetical protein Nepgr_014503 [Nepenthes gracilis]